MIVDSFLRRFTLAFAASFVVVGLTSIAVTGRSIDLSGFIPGSIGIFAISFLAAAISAFAWRRDLVVALSAQLMVVIAMLALQFVLWA